MTGFLRKGARKVKSLLRPVYHRVAFLQRLRQKLAVYKSATVQRINSQVASPDNLPALQALVERRFDPDALLSVQRTALPGDVPEVDVSVVSYNSQRWVKSFVASLAAQDYPLSKLHLRFVDHGSTDNTLAEIEACLTPLKGRFASITIIQQPNLGFGAGHHRAISQGHSALCLVTNLDLEFSPEAIVRVVETALSDTKEQVACWEFRQAPYEHPKYYDPVTLEVNWSSHACVLLRRSAYLAVGGYDSRLFMYAEDVELSYRFRSYGFVLKYVPCAVVYHHTYEQAGQVKPMQYSGSTVGNTYLRLRYGPPEQRKLALSLYLSLFFRPSPCPGAKKALTKNTLALRRNWRHFCQGKGPAKAYFPFRGFDYEYVRDGAFYTVQPLDTGSLEPWVLASDNQATERRLPSNTDLPKVTIITRTYQGRGMFLRQCMRSVFNQTYPLIEWIVVEDGGHTQEALVNECASLAPDTFEIRFIAHAKLGRSPAGNAGLAASTGQYLMFLDDDDLLFADHVETLVGAIQRHTGVSAAYALSIEVLTDVSADKTHYVETGHHTPHLFRQEWDHEVMLHHNFIPIQAILFDRVLFDERGGFEVDLDQLEDWNLWLRYGYQRQFVFVDKTTSLFRSPSQPDVRSERAAKLHEAYCAARNRAVNKMKNIIS